MPPWRRLSRFFLLLLFWYAAFQTLWHVGGAKRWYSAAFRSVGTQAFVGLSKVGGKWMVALLPAERPSDRLDTDLTLANSRTRAVARQPISTDLMAYTPLTITLTLILATPIGWRRRAWASVLGWLLATAWTAGGLVLLVVRAYGTPGTEITMYEWGPAALSVLGFLAETATVSTITPYVVPLFIWVLVTLRRGDLQRFLDGEDEPRTGAASVPRGRSMKERKRTPDGQGR